MLYTKKGDLGDTGMYGCDQRISKSSKIAEALGVLDETNSFLGVCKVESEESLINIIHQIQENLFIVSSQVAGSDKKITDEEISKIENKIDEIEEELPEIKSFFMAGGTKLSANLDFARTLVRRAERRVVAVNEEGVVKIDDNTLKYLNRLSSLLYALVRQVNYREDVTEESPKY